MDAGLRILSGVDENYPALDERIEVCTNIFDWLCAVEFSPIENKLNSLQCSFRKNGGYLNSMDKMAVRELMVKYYADNSTKGIQIKIATNLLLQDLDEAQLNLDLLDQQEQEHFKDIQFAIYLVSVAENSLEWRYVKNKRALFETKYTVYKL